MVYTCSPILSLVAQVRVALAPVARAFLSVPPMNSLVAQTFLSVSPMKCLVAQTFLSVSPMCRAEAVCRTNTGRKRPR